MARPCREREPTGAGSDWSADHRNTTLTPPGSPKHRGHMCPHKPSCISSTRSVLAGGMWNVWRAKTSERQSTTGRPQFDWTVERIVTEHVQWSSELKVTASDVFPPNWQHNNAVVAPCCHHTVSVQLLFTLIPLPPDSKLFIRQQQQQLVYYFASGQLVLKWDSNFK